MQPIEIAIRDAVDEIVVPAYGPTAYTCRTWPWQVITPGEYGDAWSPTHPSGRQVATEARSRLVDVIPNVAPDYSPRGRVEETYEHVLRFAHAKAMDVKQLVPMSDFTRMAGRLQAEMAERTEVTVAANDGTPVKTLALTEQARAAAEGARRRADAAALARATASVQRLDPAIAAASPAPAAQVSASAPAPSVGPHANAPAADPPSVDGAFYSARSMFEMSRLAMAGSPAITYHPSYLAPENVADGDAAADWPSITLPMPDGMSLALRFTRVDIFRPWFLLSLFELPGWQTDQAPGSLSSGTTDGNAGTFPLLPVSMIVARDIRASRGADILFQASGLQVVAWINRIIPFSPH